MARTHGNIPCSLWNDPLFTAHTTGEQLIYICLLTQRNLSLAGVLPLTPNRWARMTNASSAASVVEEINALAASHFVEVDHDTDEVFVSGYFASEFIGRQPRRAAAAHDATMLIYSRRLHAVAQAELRDEFRAANERTPRGLRATVLERDGYRCKQCGWRPGTAPDEDSGAVVYNALEVDHIHPRALGGSDDLSNLQALCVPCNTRKAAKV
jgi:hypothetical protein